MVNINFYVCALVIFAAAVCETIYSVKTKALRKFLFRENFPKELLSASLIASESDIACEYPVKLHGRLDQLFRLLNGCVVLVDTKCRSENGVDEADIIQLSVYRFILRQLGYPVLGYAWVRTVSDPLGRRSVRYIKVSLLSDDDIIKLSLLEQRSYA